MDFTDKPTSQLIDSLVTQFTKLWAEANAQNEIVDSYVNQTFDLWPKGINRPQYYPATAASKIEMAVAVQLAYEPTVHRNPVGRGSLAEARADEIEPWMREAFREAGLQEPSLSWKGIGRHFIKYGHGVIEGPLWVDFDEAEPERRPGEGEADFELRHGIWSGQKANWFPFRIRSPNPSTVLLDPWVKQPPVVVRVSTRYAYDLEALTRRKGQRREGVRVYDAGDTPFQVIEVTEYWSNHWHALKLKGGEMLYVEENEAGFTPFCHAYGEFGGLPAETGGSGRVDGFDVKHIAQGILQPVLDGLKLEAQSFVSGANMLDVAGWPREGADMDTAEAAQLLNRDGVLPGKKETFWYRQVPLFPDYLFRASAGIRQNIEEGTYPQSLAGYRDAGVTTVGQQAILIEAADKRFGGCRQQLNHLATITGQRLLRLVDIAGEDVTVGAYTIGPDEIRHNYNVSVKFELVDPVLQMQREQLNLEYFRLGLKSAETVRLEARSENEVEERKRLLKEDVRKLPPVHQFLAEQAMKEEGLGQILEQMQAAQAAAEQPPAVSPQQGVGGERAPLGPSVAGTVNAGLRKMLTPAVANPPRKR